MAARFPVPIQFELPNHQWSGAAPEASGVPDALAVAFRWGSIDDGYVPVLTVRGIHGPALPSLEEVAAASVDALRVHGSRADLVKRTCVESPHMSAIVQLTEVDAVIEGDRHDLYQAQVIETLTDASDSRKKVFLSFAVTCKYGQFARVGPEFEAFMESVVLGG